MMRDNNYNSGIRVPGENISLSDYLQAMPRLLKNITRRIKITKILLEIKNPII